METARGREGEREDESLRATGFSNRMWELVHRRSASAVWEASLGAQWVETS